ncbi:hypothetical protein EYF80_033421 [Liparis tanakae]|uniref:Uncharacterized protein n=1 Tax=Liparis tanakae TaxID=230148 RepID=A0A4Z2GTF2_9TELE|nr:hypothetical protein EYF80_033421 [Liparis tanakae]
MATCMLSRLMLQVVAAQLKTLGVLRGADKQKTGFTGGNELLEIGQEVRLIPPELSPKTAHFSWAGTREEEEKKEIQRWRLLGFPLALIKGFLGPEDGAGGRSLYADSTPPIPLTLMSVREMEPLPSTSQVWKNSLVLSSRAMRPQSEGLLPGVGPRPFALLSSSMSGTLSSGGVNFGSFGGGVRHEASSLALYPRLWGSCGHHGDKDGKLRQMNVREVILQPCDVIMRKRLQALSPTRREKIVLKVHRADMHESKKRDSRVQNLSAPVHQ